MRIKEFHIKKYGPLSFTKLVKLNNFTIFYGENESGKTLTIEAILKILVGKKEAKDRIYENIERVEEYPDGYLIIEDGEKLIRVQNGEFLKHFELSHEELKNIFIIRNSDLSIEFSQKNKEPDVYSKVSEKLVGSQISKIQSIKSKILENSIITESGMFKDQKEAKYKQYFERINKLIEEIDNLLPKLEKSDYFEIEEQIAVVQKELEALRAKVKSLETSKQIATCKELLEDIAKLESLVNELSNYKTYTNENLQKYVELENKIEWLKDEIDKVTNEKQKLKDKVENINKEIERIENNISLLRENSKNAEKIKERINGYLYKNSEMSNKYKNKNILLTSTFTAIVLAIILFLTISGTIFKAVITAAGIVTTLFLFALYSKLINQIRAVEQLRKEILREGQITFRTTFTDIESLENECLNTMKDYEKTIEEETGLRNRKTEFEREIDNLEDQLKDLTEQHSRAETDLETLKNLLSVNSAEGLRQKLNERSKLEGTYQALKSQILTKIKTYGVKLDGLPKDLPEPCGPEIAGELAKIKDTLVKYMELMSKDRTKEESEELKQLAEFEEYEEKIMHEIEKLQKQLEDLRNKERQLQELMKFIFAKAKESKLLDEIFDEVPDVVYKSDLIKLRNELREFIDELTKRQNIEKTALEILRKIEEEERESISNLFKQSNLIKIFTEITDGKYIDVVYGKNKTDEYIKVRSADGQEFTPEQLSAGTYDQLYFAIRLALAEHLFGKENGQKAFFILDDPFVKYDKKRLLKQIQKLVELSNQGWQFLYFTAKDEIVDLGERLGIDIINLDEIVH
ncbi:AAA domain-containing protein [Fervidobacterium changbaicum]|uniref:AAA family ATPase n=2 Tax=Fervidobacterium TaxID=2422 RepID=A0AAI8CMA8_FERIS|nr:MULTISPECIES: AAA family ATPase [Fervidobacterium]AMW33099.1 AAA family ATPase [Fervidobacterium islandicum]QAV33140.1 hypothetical protein CBS1_04945 [Fervidobacterium changbaicum]SDH11408.1 AAA domain-containing protein [Fervidobacterium changbaicum]